MGRGSSRQRHSLSSGKQSETRGTTHAIRAAIQRVVCYGQGAGGASRDQSQDGREVEKEGLRPRCAHGPKKPRSTGLTIEEEAIAVAFRKHTLLRLDDCLYALQATIPHLNGCYLRCISG
jgi:hypothetical protein